MGIHGWSALRRNRPTKWARSDQVRGRPTTPIARRERGAGGGSPVRSSSATGPVDAGPAGSAAAATPRRKARGGRLPAAERSDVDVDIGDLALRSRSGYRDGAISRQSAGDVDRIVPVPGPVPVAWVLARVRRRR